MPNDHLNLAISLNYLASLFKSRFKQTGSVNDLKEAIFNAEHAVTITKEYLDLAIYLSNHA
jgi:hypothetical protein